MVIALPAPSADHADRATLVRRHRQVAANQKAGAEHPYRKADTARIAPLKQAGSLLHKAAPGPGSKTEQAATQKAGAETDAEDQAWWIGENLINVSIYIADARELNLPLVGGGDHDWNELFYRFGLLSEESAATVSGGTHLVGTLVMVFGLFWWSYFVVPTRLQRRIHDEIVGRSPAMEALLPDPDSSSELS